MAIATPESYADMIDRAKAGGYAIPAINVTSSQTLSAALQGFTEAESDGIVQVSNGGAAYWSGSSRADRVKGSLAMSAYAYTIADLYPITFALHTDHCPRKLVDTWLRPLLEIEIEQAKRGEPTAFQSHMWDGSAETLDDNIKLAVELLAMSKKANTILEIEIGVVGGEEKKRAALDLGYDEVWLRADLENAEPGQFDVIADPVAGPGRITSLELLRLGGRLLAVGDASQAGDQVVSSNTLWLKGIGVHGFNLGAMSAAHPRIVGTYLRRALALVASGEVTVHIAERAPIQDAPRVLTALRDGRTIGKTVFVHERPTGSQP